MKILRANFICHEWREFTVMIIANCKREWQTKKLSDELERIFQRILPKKIFLTDQRKDLPK